MNLEDNNSGIFQIESMLRKDFLTHAMIMTKISSQYVYEEVSSHDKLH